MFSSAPLAFQLELKLTLTVAIALQRTLVIGFFIIVFTVMILFNLRLMENRSMSIRTRAEKEANRFYQANLTSAGMLLSSLLFITIPSVGVGFLEMIGYSIFRRVDPFYTVELLCAGR
ncbi:hypothetical protein ANCDUO_02948 [Ancylostoma duodenale]|uniref:Uncharacterized protein n=1 Tax=Ancylostoma duodenale TaxID=51022 RepID=A0A0C2DV38_9BILA|nr:hypothetical protein ANCDUO_02948 [Ancylostoma duodenale]